MITLDLVLASAVIAAFAAAVSAGVLVPSHAVELAREQNDLLAKSEGVAGAEA